VQQILDARIADEDFYGSSNNPLNGVNITSEDLKGYQKMKGYRQGGYLPSKEMVFVGKDKKLTPAG
jgi:hypothetical protein